MNRTNPTRWLHLNLALLIFVTPFFMAGFQNCAPNKFDVAADTPDTRVTPGACDNPSDPGCVPVCPDDNPECNVTPPVVPCDDCNFELIDQIVQTDPGVPKEFNAQYTGDKKDYQLSFQNNAVVTTLTIPDVGSVAIINQPTFLLRFTPLPAFTGSRDIALHAIEGTSRLIDSSRVTLAAGVVTSIPIVQPALAVRASACVMCHADVRSNIITDFGYGGDGKGRDYYMGKNIPNMMGYAWNNGAIYGDDKAFNVLGNWAQLKLESGKKVLLPKNAPVTGQPATMSGATNLKDYLKQRFSLSPYASTVNATIAEYSSIYIGAPSAERLRTVFGVAASSTDFSVPFPYAKSTTGGANLNGLSISGAAAYNSGVVTCEGDVLINGPLRLSNLRLNSKTGCRIYATGSIFVYGPIVYENIADAAYANSNLQLVSSRAILMGLGELWSGAAPVDGVATSCETGVTKPSTVSEFFYLKNSTMALRNEFKRKYSPNAAELKHYDDQNWSSMYSRMTFWMNGTHAFRNDSRDGWDIGDDILTEYSKIGAQKDAACEPAKRNVSYSRLLLNAPQVHSRYWGDFSGVIVSEFILPALGQFHFQFDPVFLKAPVLPKLQDTDYLKVQ